MKFDPGSRVLAVTSIGVAMSALDTTIVNVARDTLSREFSAAPSSVSWVWSAYSIVYAAVLLTSGRLADRYGRKKVYQLGLVVFTAASAMCGAAPSLKLLVAARVVQAVGGAMLTPAALALVLPAFPAEKRSTAIGTWSTIGSVAAGLGPLLGSLIIASMSWRAAFLVNVPLGVIALVVGRRVLRESRDEQASGIPDVLSIVCGIGAVGILVTLITQGNSWGYLARRPATLLASAGLLLTVFAHRCRVARQPVFDLGLLRSRSYIASNSAAIMFAIPFYGSLFINVTYLQSEWGYGVVKAACATLPGPVMAIIAGRLSGRLCDRFGHKVVIVPAGLIMAAAMFGFAWQAAEVPGYLARFLPFMMMTGAAIAALITALQSASVAFVPLERLAMASAFYSTLRQVGGALAVAIAAASLSRGGSSLSNYRLGWSILGTAALAMSLMVGLLYSRPRPVVARSAA